jgi:DNA-binding MarR family transcriptional regulator
MPCGLSVPDVREFAHLNIENIATDKARPMAITLTADEIRHLELLAEADKHGLTVSPSTPRGGLNRLVEAGYIVDRAISMDVVLYVITDLGRRALTNAKR